MAQLGIEPEPGLLVAGRYRLLRPLGTGGSAYVWAALDESLGREVAVKALSGSTVQGGHERERLRREALLLAALDDPHITTVFDYAETAAGDGSSQPVLVTELVEGENLGLRLKSGPLEPQAALVVCAQVAEALAAAHRSGVVHRDVKPGNVMLTAAGAKLLDFGISRRASDTDLTGKVLLGTPACMAPEQWRGLPALPASDVYALGCLLYWCLSGRAPYADRELPALGLAHLQDVAPPLPLPARHRAVEEIYRACVRKDPAARPGAERVAAVLGAADVRPMAAAPPEPDEGTATVAAPPPRRRSRIAVVSGCVVAALAASVVLPLSLAGGGAGGPKGTVPAARPSTAASSAAAARAANAARSGSTAASTGPAAPGPGSAVATAQAGVSQGSGHGKGHGRGGGNGGG